MIKGTYDLEIMKELEGYLPTTDSTGGWDDALRENILNDGKILEPIVVWAHEGKKWILDGHHRYHIAKEFQLAYEIEEKHFDSIEEAKLWMISHQMGRRNLSIESRSIYALQKKGLLEQVRKEKVSRKKLAEEAGVGEGTIMRLNTIMKHDDSETKEKVLNGEISIGKGYKMIKNEDAVSRNEQVPFPEIDEFAVEKETEINAGSGETPVKETKKEEETPKPHVTYNTGNEDWYTPASIIEAARSVMGRIDLDVASCEEANKTVKAERFYSILNDGLGNPWFGRIWMNPPYAKNKIKAFADKLDKEKDNIEEAMILVNNATETQWFRTLINHADAVCFPKGRVHFIAPQHIDKDSAPLQGQAIIYIGDNLSGFEREFSEFGWVAFLH